jgi:hypothetical protein
MTHNAEGRLIPYDMMGRQVPACRGPWTSLVIEDANPDIADRNIGGAPLTAFVLTDR